VNAGWVNRVARATWRGGEGGPNGFGDPDPDLVSACIRALIASGRPRHAVFAVVGVVAAVGVSLRTDAWPDRREARRANSRNPRSP